MKTKKLNTKDGLLTLYCFTYVFKYLRMILVQAQIENEALANLKINHAINSQKLVRLNLKHNKLSKGLYDQKLKIQNCA